MCQEPYKYPHTIIFWGHSNAPFVEHVNKLCIFPDKTVKSSLKKKKKRKLDATLWTVAQLNSCFLLNPQRKAFYAFKSRKWQLG